MRADAIDFARGNAGTAGVANWIEFVRQDLTAARPPAGPPGVMILNPPYGERIGEERELLDLYAAIGRTTADHWPGWKLFVFTNNDHLARAVGRRTVRKMPFFNGTIECRLCEYVT